MPILFILIPLAMAMAAAGIVAFLWAVRGGQMDDLVTPALRAIQDDDATAAPCGGNPTTDGDGSDD